MADGNEYGVVLLKEAGQPVEPVYPTEGTPTISGPTAIFATAPIRTRRGCSRRGCTRGRPSSSSSITPRNIRRIRR